MSFLDSDESTWVERPVQERMLVAEGGRPHNEQSVRIPSGARQALGERKGTRGGGFTELSRTLLVPLLVLRREKRLAQRPFRCPMRWPQLSSTTIWCDPPLAVGQLGKSA